jgi:Domain of unknown function (DUF3883)
MHFAVKKLTRSDLTFFEHQFRRNNKVRQKGVNLSAKVFVDLMYPYARTLVTGDPHSLPVKLQIYGPGLRTTPDPKTRKITGKSRQQKNWRLNGEFIPDPSEDPTRYHKLDADDLVVFAFEDSHSNSLPDAIAMVLLSNAEAEDMGLIAELQRFLGGSEMRQLPAELLASISSNSPAEHPIRQIIDIEQDTALEEAAQGSTEAIRQLVAKPSTRRMTGQALAKARARAESNGRDGEVLVNVYLELALEAGSIQSFKWVSEENAIAPWDFELVDAVGRLVRVEVKSTSGGFDRALHISHNEVLSAAEAGAPQTDIYRVFALSDDGAWLKVSRGIAPFCQSVVTAVAALGAGVSPDGYSVNVERFSSWSEPERLTYDEPDEA